jgi:hypothetical protein
MKLRPDQEEAVWQHLKENDNIIRVAQFAEKNAYSKTQAKRIISEFRRIHTEIAVPAESPGSRTMRRETKAKVEEANRLVEKEGYTRKRAAAAVGLDPTGYYRLRKFGTTAHKRK